MSQEYFLKYILDSNPNCFICGGRKAIRNVGMPDPKVAGPRKRVQIDVPKIYFKYLNFLAKFSNVK